MSVIGWSHTALRVTYYQLLIKKTKGWGDFCIKKISTFAPSFLTKQPLNISHYGARM